MTEGDSIIELRLPPSLRFGNVVRVIAASIAADEHFSIAALAELRAAVQEAFEMLLEHTVPTDRGELDEAIAVRFSIAPGQLDVEFAMASDAASSETASTVPRRVEGSGYVLLSAHRHIALTTPA